MKGVRLQLPGNVFVYGAIAKERQAEENHNFTATKLSFITRHSKLLGSTGREGERGEGRVGEMRFSSLNRHSS